MNIFLRVLFRNISLGFGVAISVVGWTAILWHVALFLNFLGLPAGLCVALFLMSMLGSFVAVIFTIIEVVDRNLVSFNDINRLFGIPEKEEPPKKTYRY